MNIMRFQRRAKILPACGELIGSHRHAGRGLNLIQDSWTPGVKMRQRQAQPANQQRCNDDERGSSEQ
ncbi:Uncharacterised protein [Salmonella enterica subsp. arizonae]|uniref:Uncharacterized protein n=1 Tax=Salmonella enterica subsp. arizonae TaxID=59203 RepID=A0A379RZ41_SALER|nr:Uncharacterised protein [Salmonella enterica subsp. arizonae]